MENQPVQPIVTESPIETAPASNLKPKRSGLIFILIALVVLLLGTTVYFASKNLQVAKKPIPQTQTTNTPTVIPTIDPTANWKTYTTSTYQVKYPNDIDTQEEEASVFILSKWGPTQKEATELYDGISLRFQPFEIPNVDLRSYVQNKIQDSQVAGTSEILSGPTLVNIGSYSGLTYTTRGLGTHKYIYFQSTDKVMIMEIIDSTVDPKNQGFQQISDDIISTFKFIGQPDNGISGSYSIKIPSSWSGKYKLTTKNDISCDSYDFIGETSNYKLFSICRMTLEEWTTNQNLSGPGRVMSELKLTSDEKFVYFYNSSLDNPYLGDEGEGYQNLSLDIPVIVKTFKLN